MTEITYYIGYSIYYFEYAVLQHCNIAFMSVDKTLFLLDAKLEEPLVSVYNQVFIFKFSLLKPQNQSFSVIELKSSAQHNGSLLNPRCWKGPLKNL